jgi:hypothetical protein
MGGEDSAWSEAASVARPWRDASSASPQGRSIEMRIYSGGESLARGFAHTKVASHKVIALLDICIRQGCGHFCTGSAKLGVEQLANQKHCEACMRPGLV